MVSTRAASTRPAPGIEKDDNRVIVVVTGANSGFGLGLCQQLLSNLSLPPGTPMPASTPQLSATPPALRHYLSQLDDLTKEVPSPPPTLTLILACRSETKAKEAREILLRKHHWDLEKREARGEPVREGWKEGLRVVWEAVDLDAMGGKNGVLAFCERLKDGYPHITTLCLNAGMGAWSGIDWLGFIKQFVVDGMPLTLSQPRYQLEEKGVLSADGERGMVWGTNVLAPYIMAHELTPLLRRSPSKLPFSPRIIYTSSLTSWYSKLPPNPLDDYQLLESQATYSASKYMGDAVMCALDRDLGVVNEGEREVRVLTADPGCVTTNFFNAGLAGWGWWANIKWMGYWLAFYICRLLGSRWHPVYPDQGALPLIYAALIPSILIPAASQVPAPRYRVVSERWGRTSVECDEVDRWEEGEVVGRGMIERCDVMRKEWKRREGLE
ncbi:hypothetical protein IAU60_005661 [Kwoniella sp. DSM 27419]